MWPFIVTCDRASWHVTVHRDIWPCIVTCDHASWHVTVHRDIRPCIVTCDRASWHMAVHRDIWPASWHVTMHRDMWQCIVTYGRSSWHMTVHRDMWSCIVTNFFIIKPTRYTNFSNLFWHKTLHVSAQFVCPLSGVYSLYTQKWYMTYQDGTAVPSWSCSKAVYKPVWHIPLLSGQ